MFSLLRNPHLLLAITALGWAGNAVAGKYAVGHISPMVLTFSRWAFALALISLFAHKQIRADLPVIRKNWLYLLLMGGLGYATFNAVLYTALIFTSTMNVTIEQTAMPLFIFALNYVLYRIQVTWLQIVGYILTFVGVVVTATNGQPLALISDGLSSFGFGDALMMVASFLYAAYSVGLRSKPDMAFTSFMAALMAGGFLFSLVGLAVEHAFLEPIWPTTLQGLLVALYAGVVPSLVCQMFFVIGVAALGANRAGLYINLVPVFGALLIFLMLEDGLYVYHAIATILVVGGVMIAQRGTAAS